MAPYEPPAMTQQQRQALDRRNRDAKNAFQRLQKQGAIGGGCCLVVGVTEGMRHAPCRILTTCLSPPPRCLFVFTNRRQVPVDAEAAAAAPGQRDEGRGAGPRPRQPGCRHLRRHRLRQDDPGLETKRACGCVVVWCCVCLCVCVCVCVCVHVGVWFIGLTDRESCPIWSLF